MITIIVAYSKNRVIGYNNSIPWNLPEDLKNFKKITSGFPIIMGRNTWESLPFKPLPNRTNIVVTSKDMEYNGVIFVKSLGEALRQALLVNSDIFIIGGESIYKQSLLIADRIIATEVNKVVNGDTYFPEVSGFNEVSRVKHLDFDIVEYVKSNS